MPARHSSACRSRRQARRSCLAGFSTSNAMFPDRQFPVAPRRGFGWSCLASPTSTNRLAATHSSSKRRDAIHGGRRRNACHSPLACRLSTTRAGGPSMQVSSISRAALAVLLSGALACSADRIQSPLGAALSPGPASLGAVDQSAAATYNWHAGDAFLIALNPAFGPAVAEASNGERVELKGTGTLGIHPNSATGGGTFVHRNAAG